VLLLQFLSKRSLLAGKKYLAQNDWARYRVTAFASYRFKLVRTVKN